MDTLHLLPMGGLGEIGMNMTLYGFRDDWIMVDAGVQFAEPSMIGAEQVLQDLDLLADYRDRIRGIVLTHGHEDHIGAVEHIADICRVPVFAPPFVVELIRLKFQEFGAASRPDLRPVRPGERLDFGAIQVETVRVTHSIPDSLALALHTPVGTIVHTGDFKIDPDPVDGRAFDAGRLAALGDRGVRLLLSDSTNAQVPGRSRPEQEVRMSLEEVIAQAPGRVIVSMFASNVHRVHGLIETGHRLSRRVALVGKSLSIYLDAARRSGQGITPPDFVDPHRLDQVPDRHLLVICTGSQSEPRSALYRASLQEHPDLHVHPGDTVILSSRIIPGNERGVFRMTNNLTRLGAVVVHERMAPVHGSGHAQRDELVEMMRLVRPRTFIPIHGEYAFLKSHADLALEQGLAEVRVIENGHLLEVTRDEVVVAERLPLNWHYVDGPLVGDADELRLSERKRIGWNGVIAARLSARRVRNRWKAEVDLQSVGVPLDDSGVLDEAARDAAEQIVSLPREASRKALEDTLVGALRSFFRKRNDKKPTILPFIEVPED